MQWFCKVSISVGLVYRLHSDINLGITVTHEYAMITADYYPSTLANSTLIILFSEMLKFSKIIFFQIKKCMKDNSEYLGIFHLLKRVFQN
jgi:hypothetical protein